MVSLQAGVLVWASGSGRCSTAEAAWGASRWVGVSWGASRFVPQMER